MEKLKHTIKKLLTVNTLLRDDYVLLYQSYLAENGISVFDATYAAVKWLQCEGKIKSESSVERVSRLLQEKNPHLRGANWSKRQRKSVEVRKNIKNL